jgi:hypothetical protein
MTDPDEVRLQPWVRTMQIIAGAMMLGVVFCLGTLSLVVVQAKGQGMMQPPPDFPMVTAIAVVLLVSNVPLSFGLPVAVTRQALRRIAAGTWQPPAQNPGTTFATDSSKLLAVRQTSLIIGLALLEAAGLLGCIAYLLEADPIALGVVAVALAFQLARFPTEGRVRAWLEQQADRLAELRQQGASPE